MEFKHRTVIMPKCDCDLTIKFPGGEEITIQARPSNADVNCNGSLDIILPTDQPVTTWKGDDMEDSDAFQVFNLDTRKWENREYIRVAKQLALTLPGDYSE